MDRKVMCRKAKTDHPKKKRTEAPAAEGLENSKHPRENVHTQRHCKEETRRKKHQRRSTLTKEITGGREKKNLLKGEGALAHYNQMKKARKRGLGTAMGTHCARTKKKTFALSLDLKKSKDKKNQPSACPVIERRENPTYAQNFKNLEKKIGKGTNTAPGEQGKKKRRKIGKERVICKEKKFVDVEKSQGGTGRSNGLEDGCGPSTNRK